MEEKSKIIEAMLSKPETQPEALKPLFVKLASVRNSYIEMGKAIAKTQNALQELYSNRDKAVGAGEVVIELIAAGIPDAETTK